MTSSEVADAGRQAGEELDLDAIERRADGVLAEVPDWIWDGDKLPVPIEDLADSHFGLHVREVEEMTTAPGSPELSPDQSLSGLLLASRGEIWVNASEAREWPPRRRFTIGHEVGHWVLHRRGQQSLFCRKPSVAPDQMVLADELEPERPGPRPPLPLPEAEANAFAAALLMPVRLIRRHHEHTTKDFDGLCELFDSSARAMQRRLEAVL